MATVSCHHAASATVHAVALGQSQTDLMKQAGINPELLGIPFSRINERQMTQLVQSVRKLLNDEFMGFTQTPCPLGAFGFMVNSIKRCSTLREALQQGISFYNLITQDIRTTLIEHTDTVEIRAHLTHPEKDHNHFYFEFWMITWHRLSCWLTGTRIPLLTLNMTHPSPEHADELRHLFPCQHRFKAPHGSFSFHAQHLKRPLIRSEKEIQAFIQNAPYDMLTIPGTDHSLKNTILRLVDEKDHHALRFPPIEEIAENLHLSVSTLHRRLKEEATSYQKIKDDIRRDIALTKLIKERLPVHEVAHLLGFSESRSFTRAFKQWTGLSPREYCRFI